MASIRLHYHNNNSNNNYCFLVGTRDIRFTVKHYVEETSSNIFEDPFCFGDFKLMKQHNET